MPNANNSSTPHPVVAILLTPAMRKEIISPAAEAKLAEIATVRAPAEGELTQANLPKLLDGVSAAVSGWGTPAFNEEILTKCPSLKLISHAAGSIRHLVPLAAIEEGRLRVTHEAIHIGEAVVEFVMAQTLTFLRNPAKLDEGMKAKEPWYELREHYLGRLLGDQTVGLVGAGYVGRLMIGLFRAFNARVLVCDPYLTPERAKDLGVESRDLHDLLRESSIISIHAPSLPETRHMIGAEQLALLRDGALFINTSRGALVDEEAMIAALRGGRFTAALDVFQKEPLPDDSPLRTLPNVLISPHAAGHTLETRLRQGTSAVEEVCSFLAGKGLRHEVTNAILATMA